MVATNEEAFKAMIQHHESLVSGVKSRSFAIQSSLGSNDALVARIVDMINFMDLEVIPHAKAEEHTIYPVASDVLDAEDLVASMNSEHEELVSLTRQLEDLADTEELSNNEPFSVASKISDLFAEHAKRENDDILSRLVIHPNVDLVLILRQMEQLFSAEKRNASQPSTLPVDREERLVSVILELSRELSRRNGTEFACRRVANAWSVLKDDRPALAQRLTNALHGLSSGIESNDIGSIEDECVEEILELDVRTMVPKDRHAAIFEAYYELRIGSSFVLINDHDPKPLRYQFEVEHPDEFTWKYLESGPSLWRVRIGRI